MCPNCGKKHKGDSAKKCKFTRCTCRSKSYNEHYKTTKLLKIINYENKFF